MSPLPLIVAVCLTVFVSVSLVRYARSRPAAPSPGQRFVRGVVLVAGSGIALSLALEVLRQLGLVAR